MVRKIWKKRRANKGDIVLLNLCSYSVVGIYGGVLHDNYVLFSASCENDKPYLVRVSSVMTGEVLGRRCLL